MFLLLSAIASASLLATDGQALPLTQTDVHARVMADVAVVDVVQTFENPYEVAIDATYVFPLPNEAAVRDLTVTCGERVIESQIMTHEAAAAAYDKARSEGKRTALLEQQRSNLFTQHVAGLCPGETVQVSIQYVEALAVDAGVHSFVFPTTTGDRYDPVDLQQAPLVQGFPSPDAGRAFRLRLEVDAGMPLLSIWSDTYPIVVVGEDANGAEIELLEADAVPNADVHVSWTQESSVPQATVLTARQNDEPYVSLTLTPPTLEAIDDDDLRPRELVFVLDASCSMRGAPWEAAQDTVRTALDHMRATDRFNVVRFSSAAGSAFERPMPATLENIRTAYDYMSRFDGGGTEMSAGIIEALDQPGDPEALRSVVLLTDGYIGSEHELFRITRAHLSPNDRIFALGIGSSVNRLLLEGLAHHGRGVAEVQLPGTPVAETVAHFYRRIDRPVLTDIQVDWGALGVTESALTHPADLYAGQPLHLVAKPSGASFGLVTVTGTLAAKPYRVQVPVDLDEGVEHAALPTLWARRAIQRLGWEEDPQESEITAIALANRLVSTYTSLVAVDRHPGGCQADATVNVPALVPSGTVATAVDSGGMGSRGLGMGGGGANGLSGLRTEGIHSGRSGYGTGGGNFGSKGSNAIGRTGGDPIILGSIDRSVIETVIKANLRAIRYCYQRSLHQNPNLGGKVVVKFTIATDGTIAAAVIKTSTLNHDAVEQCITRRFKRMKFPVPAGGGGVIVSYPFIFAPQ